MGSHWYGRARQYEPYKVLIEDKASGIQLVQDLGSDPSGVRGTAMQPKADKVTRLSSESA